nr:immunoglobulin heavy chain junction region [Macaca mulatta]MOX59329.1 immunoglobulin heavy chain junction region [Macaca mulatta]MOX59639.1 immunoglobulin heavy chain junction region [Macaca mulatta]MOX59894.1 immunoglobulin heavy chain junction region [Macaca mulatta]MOX59992.1 immunoglobulin heavy chain junction region [Macaca mulatta]
CARVGEGSGGAEDFDYW